MDTPKLHGCVTAWLVLMIVANSITALVYLFMPDTIFGALPGTQPAYAQVLLPLMALANLGFAIMLFQLKKWAFYGFVVTSLLAVGVNLSMGLGIASSLSGLVGVGILYGILQLEKDGVNAWERME